MQVNFCNKGMYVYKVKFEILNSDEEVIFSQMVLRGSELKVVTVSEPVVPGDKYWIRKTYFDGKGNEVSTLMLQVTMTIGL